MANFSLEKMKQILLKNLRLKILPGQIEKALVIAYYGHEGQYRDPKNPTDNLIPYIVHPVGVAIIANKMITHVDLEDSYEDIISACLAHDILEDTNMSPQKLAQETSSRTMEIVLSLSKPMVQPGTNHHQRNEQFFKQIVKAGQTSMFIKVCDHCHNLSRPLQTPTRLMEKAIKKGRTTVMRYFDHEYLPVNLKRQFLEYLTNAEKENCKIKQKESLDSCSWTLDKAIKYSVQVASRKVLEIHDLVEIVSKITSHSFVRYGSSYSFVEEVVLNNQKIIKQNLRAQLDRQIKNGIMEFSLLPKEIRRQISFPADTLFFLNIPLSDSYEDNMQSIIVGTDEKIKPEWVDFEPLQLIVTFLSERLRVQERDINATLANELKNLKLNIDVEKVRLLHMDINDLKQIRKLLDYSEFVRKRMHYELEYKLLAGGNYIDLPLIESRVKSPHSLINKMLHRNNIQELSDVDDIIGFRIVCLSTLEVNIITKNLITFLESIFPDSSNPKHQPGKKIGVNEISTKDGYKAFHSYFTIPFGNDPIMTIGCEIQIRTVFQDAWARVSHTTAYKIKSAKKSQNKAQKAMKQLAILREKADLIIAEQII